MKIIVCQHLWISRRTQSSLHWVGTPCFVPIFPPSVDFFASDMPTRKNQHWGGQKIPRLSQLMWHWGHLVQTPQISLGFKDKKSRESWSPGCSVSHRFCINRPVLACLIIFSLNVRQSLAWRPSLLRAAMTIVAILASSRSFSPPGSLLPISYTCLGRLGVRAPSGNLLLLLLQCNPALRPPR